MPPRPRIPRQLQNGPFTVAEARAAGVSPRSLSGRSWRRIERGIYCWSAMAPDAFRLLAVWHRAQPAAIFCGRTAAWLHGLDTEPIDPIEVILPLRSGTRSRPGLRVRRCDLPLSETTTVRGMRATTVRQTLRDLGRRLSRPEALVLADAAMRLGLGRFDELAEPAESPMETRLRWLLLKAGLPRPEVQSDLHDSQGRFVGRADIYYPMARLVIEFDGGNHRDRLVGDNRRQNLLINAGFKVLRFTASDLYNRPETIVALVSAGAAISATRQAAAPH